MSTRQPQSLDQPLELLESSTTQPNFLQQMFLSTIQGLWNRFCYRLLSSESPQFSEVSGKDGQVYWQVYDPVTDRRFYLNSLQAVLEWIEARHYQRSQASSLFDR
ncbi:MAG: hypothetical protein KME42_20480 [Tildeniella nuda ZEHNDER 1965/U140]|nr:hypothetical protein [Tildeniella nuda ZEHNDER 1965/U140]